MIKEIVCVCVCWEGVPRISERSVTGTSLTEEITDVKTQTRTDKLQRKIAKQRYLGAAIYYDCKNLSTHSLKSKVTHHKDVVHTTS